MAVNSKPADDLPIVIDYLERNPNLFLDNPKLLSKLNLPHINDKKVTSLIEYQVEHLRKNQRLLNSQIEDLIKKQEQCNYLTQKVHEQALTLMETEKIEVLYDKLFMFLKCEYQCSRLLVFFFTEQRPYPDYRDLRFKPIHSKLRYLFSGLYNVNRPLCDSLQFEYIDALFGKESSKIKSTVSLPIKANDALGLFILGSEEYNVYQQGEAITLLSHLKDVFINQFDKLIR